jgi:argininosuccinate lyase
MKLWEKGYSPDSTIEKFTVGNDYILDLELLPYDIKASKAHASVLENAGVISPDEKEKLTAELDNILALSESGKFIIDVSDEDCHTAIENHLTEKLGELGKKIHTARSRNDQVLTAMRLLEKDRMQKLIAKASDLYASVVDFADKNRDTPMPGFTHTRKAMPYTLGKYFKALADSIKDDLSLARTILKIIDQNPLGTGAGYDVPFNLDREISTKEMGFGKTMENSLYAQNSRGKMEASILFACSSLLSSLNRWAADMVIFTMPEFGYFSLDDSLTTGSSIMPHKKNPDVLELLRSSFHRVNACLIQVQGTSINLVSGYNRDIQLTKEPVLTGLNTTLACLEVSAIIISGISVNKEELQAAMTDELFSVEKVYRLVQQGVPFREAYKIVAEMILKGDNG